MMGSVAFHLTSKQPLEKIRAMAPGSRLAMRQALNRTLTGMKTDISREARAVYNISHAAVTEATRLTPAVGENLTAVATVSGRAIKLYKFDPRPKLETGTLQSVKRKGERKLIELKRPKIGVSVRVHKREKRIVKKHSFIAAIKNVSKAPATFGVTSYHRGVFKRLTSKSLPIMELTGPSVPQMVKQPGITERIMAGARARYGKNLAAAMKYQLGKLGITVA